jgi:hypothetical protein
MRGIRPNGPDNFGLGVVVDWIKVFSVQGFSVQNYESTDWSTC